MSNIIEYKGYHAELEVDLDDGIIVGTVIGVNDTLCFHAFTVEEAKGVFENCINEYLDMCKEFGREPDKEYKGSFNVRITPDLHKAADLEARKRKQSLNQFVSSCIENEILGHKETVIVYTAEPIRTLCKPNKNGNILDFNLFSDGSKEIKYYA